MVPSLPPETPHGVDELHRPPPTMKDNNTVLTSSNSPWHRMPAEIRCMIWECTWESHCIKRSNDWGDLEFQAAPLSDLFGPPPARGSCPVTLHISQESRDFTLKHYSLENHSYLDRNCYINLQKDVLEADNPNELFDELMETDSERRTLLFEMKTIAFHAFD
ncbi:hypothetical protein G7046_g9959 [Stylonectria norvegica]|nr:hypothetical protein G7046_g9959 [Stylonectria norvegica]